MFFRRVNFTGSGKVKTLRLLKRSWLLLFFLVPSLFLFSQGDPEGPAAGRVDLNPQEFQEGFQKGGLLLDVRTPQEYADAHIGGAELIPLQELSTRWTEIEEYKDQPVYLYCRSGNRSRSASQVLLDKGFTEVYNLDRGIGSWMAQSLPVE